MCLFLSESRALLFGKGEPPNAFIGGANEDGRNTGVRHDLGPCLCVPDGL